MPAPKRPNNTKAVEASAAKSRRRGQETMAAKLREAGWIVIQPGGCPAHGVHPHDGRTCADCPICFPPAE